MKGRWKSGLMALTVVVSGLVGCKQQLFIHEADYNHYRDLYSQMGAPADLEAHPEATICPPPGLNPTPATVNDPERKVRYLTLAEATAIALEQGNVGSISPLFPGINNEGLLQGITVNQIGGRPAAAFSDSIRVLSMDPAIYGTDIEQSLSRFDAQFISSLTWNKQDNAVQNLLANFNNGDTANVTTGIYKMLASGGLTGITYSIDYNKLDRPPAGFAVVNPSYRPRLQAVFEQPLLKDFGVEINQIRSDVTRSVLVNGFGPTGAGDGILIARLRYDQSRAEFERLVNYMLINVEFAYWKLYASYGALFARDEALVDALEVWRVLTERRDLDPNGPGNAARARAQLETFRSQRITALATVLENERQLRGLLGMPAEDGTRLVPIDAPTLSPYVPEWNAARDETLANRVELTMARQELKVRQLLVFDAKNNLRPDLRFLATYDINGIGTRLDGSEPNNALGSFTNNDFNSWQLGFRLNVPIGFREAHALVRSARLNLARAYLQLRDEERKAEAVLVYHYRRLFEFQERIKAERAAYLAAKRQLDIIIARDKIDPKNTSVEALLNAQQTSSTARTNEFQAIADYNSAIAGVQFAKGTLLAFDNVTISDGPLPGCALRKAVDHQRERTVALVAHEQVNPGVPPCPAPGGPVVPAGGPMPPPVAQDVPNPSLATLVQRRPNRPVEQEPPIPPMSDGPGLDPASYDRTPPPRSR